MKVLKKFAAAVAKWAISSEARPFEVRVARAVGLAVLAWLGVSYG